MIPDPSLWQCHYAVIGWPVAHSLSPQLQNAAFEYYRLGAPYGKCAVPPEELNDFAANARTRLAGFNVTVPHKRQIIAALDEITPEAETVQSVNTVSVRSGRLYGDSTDGYGLAMALQDAPLVLLLRTAATEETWVLGRAETQGGRGAADDLRRGYGVVAGVQLGR